MELPRGCAVVLANDGDEQLRPSIVYLSPHGQDPMVSSLSSEPPQAIAQGSRTDAWSTVLPYIGQLAPFVEDPDVSEIMCNPGGDVFVERAGDLLRKLDASNHRFCCRHRLGRGCGSTPLVEPLATFHAAIARTAAGAERRRTF